MNRYHKRSLWHPSFLNGCYICEMSDPEVQHMEQDVGTAQALKGKLPWDEK